MIIGAEIDLEFYRRMMRYISAQQTKHFIQGFQAGYKEGLKERLPWYKHLRRAFGNAKR